MAKDSTVIRQILVTHLAIEIAYDAKKQLDPKENGLLIFPIERGFLVDVEADWDDVDRMIAGKPRTLVAPPIGKFQLPKDHSEWPSFFGRPVDRQSACRVVCDDDGGLRLMVSFRGSLSDMRGFRVEEIWLHLISRP